MGRFRVVWVVAAGSLGALACGKTDDEVPSRPQGTAGAAAGAGTGAISAAGMAGGATAGTTTGGSSSNGAGGVPTASAGMPAGDHDGGEADAGGEGGAAPEPPVTEGAIGCSEGTDARYQFCLLPPFEAPNLGPDAEVGTRRLAMSEDASLLVGLSSYAGTDEQGMFRTGERAFWWSPEVGMRLFPGDARFSCVTPDGSAVFGQDRVAGEKRAFFRWTPEQGREHLAHEFEDAPTNDVIESCPGDGSVAVGYTERSGYAHAMLWRKGQNDDQVVSLASVPSFQGSGWVRTQLSGDGSALSFYTAEVQGYAVVTHSYYWRVTNEAPAVTELLPPEGYHNCNARALSHDGTMVVGACTLVGDPNAHKLFRWTEGGTLTLLESPIRAMLVSDDTSVILGRDVNERVRRWSAAGDEPSQLFHGFVAGLSRDGSVGYVSAGTAGGSAGGISYRWDEDGITSLPTFDDETSTAVWGASPDGSAVVGCSPFNCEGEAPRGAVWDEQGIRDIAAELAAAGIEMSDVPGLWPRWVWSDQDRIRIVGELRHGTLATQTWVAELPTR